MSYADTMADRYAAQGCGHFARAHCRLVDSDVIHSLAVIANNPLTIARLQMDFFSSSLFLRPSVLVMLSINWYPRTRIFSQFGYTLRFFPSRNTAIVC